MATALNKARQGGAAPLHFPQCAGEQVLMTHIHDRYIIRAILVQGFSSFQTACLHDHIVAYRQCYQYLGIWSLMLVNQLPCCWCAHHLCSAICQYSVYLVCVFEEIDWCHAGWTHLYLCDGEPMRTVVMTSVWLVCKIPFFYLWI